MFIGAIPKQLAQQIVSHIDFGQWKKVFVGCSGSFRIEQAIKYVSDVPLFSNDVSLLSCAIGGAAVDDLPVVQFINNLECLNDVLDPSVPCDLLAGIGIAQELSKLQKPHKYCIARRNHILANLTGFAEKNRLMAQKIIDGVKINGFFPGDFRDQIDRAAQSGGGFICFAPTYKGGYEKAYSFIDSNTKWDAPRYSVWSPDDVPKLIDDCNSKGVRWLIVHDQEIVNAKCVMTFVGSNKPLFVYSSEHRASIRRVRKKAIPFRYDPIKLNDISRDSAVSISEVDSSHIAFLKNVYLAKGINFVSGMANFIVHIDGMLAGGITIKQSTYGDRTREIYLLSDFSTSRERQLSKLISMLATCSEIIETLNRRWFIRVERVMTTAFTNKPVSMKYRGIFDLVGRKPGQLNYSVQPSGRNASQIFHEWFKRHGSKN